MHISQMSEVGQRGSCHKAVSKMLLMLPRTTAAVQHHIAVTKSGYCVVGPGAPRRVLSG